MNKQEWENICNNCGWCCLIKVQDEDSDEVYYTKVVCKYMNLDNCTCTEYEKRCTLVPECLKLTPENVDKIEWMPKCCAYRKLFDKVAPKPAPKVNTFCVSELVVNEEDLEDYIIDEE